MVCVVGLGIIGEVWARHAHDAGLLASCWNRTPKNLPLFTHDLAEAAQKAVIIHIVVADPPAVQSVLGKILPTLGPGKLVIQSSTISPEWAEKNRQQVVATGASYVESPFTGSKPAAEQKKVVYFLGGEKAAREKAKLYLEKLSRKIFEFDSVQESSGIKLAMNLNIAGVAQALFESITLARKLGLPDDVFFSVLAENVSHSGVSDLKQPKLLEQDYSPQFSVKHMQKDLRLALETAGMELPLTDLVHKIYARGSENGLADLDFSSLITLLEKKTSSIH